MEAESRLPELEALLNGKSTKSRMIADLIRQITEVPDIYRFSHYLALPKVQDLRSSEFASTVDVLELFCRGTFRQYQELNAETPLFLTEKQIFNLRCLSLAILAKTSPGQKITFSAIQHELGLKDHWEVFDFLIEALNYGYVRGKLDEPAKVLYVEDWATRDLRPEEVESVRNKLGIFLHACDQTLDRTKQETVRINTLKSEAEIQKIKLLNKVESVKSTMDDFPVAEDPFRGKSESFGKLFRTRGKTSSKSGAISAKGPRS